MKIRSKLAYCAAALTIVLAVMIPFVLINFFAHGVNAMGLHVDEVFVAGPVVRTIDKGAYQIDIHQEFHPRFLQRAEPYVQFAWRPAQSLPPQISDDLDVDGDGKPDVHVTFATTKTFNDPRVTVDSLNPKFIALRDVGNESFSRMIARIDDKVIVRVPLKQ